jgi:DNA-directed RNA polymerase subunit RPC12/RpoP
MHVSDAGVTDCGRAEDLGKPRCRLSCSRCGSESVWLVFDTVTEAKRGVACPKCNPPGTPSMLSAGSVEGHDPADETPAQGAKQQ